MGEMGKGSIQVCFASLVAGAIHRTAPIIFSLEIGTTMTNFRPVIENMKSRVKGDFHARFCGKAGVKFPCLTRLCTMLCGPLKIVYLLDEMARPYNF